MLNSSQTCLKLFIFSILVSSSILTNAIKAQAALIGDTVNIKYIGQNMTIFFEDNVTVVEGTPEATFADQTVNIEAESIRTDFNNNATIPNIEQAWFFSDLDWVTPGPGRITGVNVTTNLDNYETSGPFSRVSFFDDFVAIDLGDITYTTESFIQVDLQVEHTPESSSTIALLTLGILGGGLNILRKNQ